MKVWKLSLFGLLTNQQFHKECSVFFTPTQIPDRSLPADMPPSSDYENITVSLTFHPLFVIFKAIIQHKHILQNMLQARELSTDICFVFCLVSSLVLSLVVLAVLSCVCWLPAPLFYFPPDYHILSKVAVLRPWVKGEPTEIWWGLGIKPGWACLFQRLSFLPWFLTRGCPGSLLFWALTKGWLGILLFLGHTRGWLGSSPPLTSHQKPTGQPFPRTSFWLGSLLFLAFAKVWLGGLLPWALTKIWLGILLFWGLTKGWLSEHLPWALTRGWLGRHLPWFLIRGWFGSLLFKANSRGWPGSLLLWTLTKGWLGSLLLWVLIRGWLGSIHLRAPLWGLFKELALSPDFGDNVMAPSPAFKQATITLHLI